MATIERHGPNVALQLEAEEAGLLRNLLREMKQLLEQELTVQDAVLDRLFPTAYADPADAEAFSELIGSELKDGKLEAIDAVLSIVDAGTEIDLRLPRSDIDGWLTVLTDVRLALGTRFDVTEEKMEAELDPEDPESQGIAILHWLGWMQEMFIRAITEAGDDGSAEAG
jgi:hypothetical protein